MVRPFYRTLLAHRTLLALAGSLLLACSADPHAEPPPSTAAAQAAGAAAQAAGAAGEVKAGRPAGADPGTQPRPSEPVLTRHEDGKPLGKVLDSAPLPLVKMLGQSPAEAEAHLGPPLPGSKGSMKETCVRHLDERTWFRCKHALQHYSDRTGTFDVVHVIYEDGKVSGLAFEGIPGAGAFDPRQALAKVGLALPGEPKVEEPGGGAKVWTWWNSEARLLVYSRQYRVRVSSVGGTWKTAKVEILLNDVLNADEQARVFDEKVGPDGAADAGSP